MPVRSHRCTPAPSTNNRITNGANANIKIAVAISMVTADTTTPTITAIITTTDTGYDFDCLFFAEDLHGFYAGGAKGGEE